MKVSFFMNALRISSKCRTNKQSYKLANLLQKDVLGHVNLATDKLSHKIMIKQETHEYRLPFQWFLFLITMLLFNKVCKSICKKEKNILQ